MWTRRTPAASDEKCSGAGDSGCELRHYSLDATANPAARTGPVLPSFCSSLRSCRTWRFRPLPLFNGPTHASLGKAHAPSPADAHATSEAARWFLRCFWPRWSDVLLIVKPETIIAWHRAGFRFYWRWRSRSRGGRPRITQELRDLITRLAKENPDRGAPKIHGERQKLGFTIASGRSPGICCA